MTRALVVVLALAACGDAITRDTTLEPTSGARLKLEWYLFEDGTRQVEPRTFYDTGMHTRCEPRRYIDGTIRCVPFADEALYIDQACETAVGRGTTFDFPSHFIGYDRVDGELLPARVLAAGDAREPITAYYERRDGTCEGPFSTPGDVTYYTVTSSYTPVVMRDGVAEGEHVAARLQVTDDGLRLPIELRDRARDAACSPEVRTDGSVVCAPTNAVPTALFSDPLCTAGVVIAAPLSPPPETAVRFEDSGCMTYYAVGAPYTGPLYEAHGDFCGPVSRPGLQIFELGAALDLPILERTVEDEPSRRLQRVTLGDGDFTVLDDRLYDTAIRADCRREVIGYTARCLPEATTPALTRFKSGCTLETQIAELPRRTCAPAPAFAAAGTEEGTELRAIGGPLTTPVFTLAQGFCSPYTPSDDYVAHSLGPPLGPDAFARGVRYGER